MVNVIGQAGGSNDEVDVDQPHPKYDELEPIWKRNRAIIGGERDTKNHDKYLDTFSFNNILLPFSTGMSQKQYEFLKAEAELPGICSQYVSMLVGGLLRKNVLITLPEKAPEEAKDWIVDHFTSDNMSLVSFLDNAIFEELNTTRTWVWVDLPDMVLDKDGQPVGDVDEIYPFPTLIPAEKVINWKSDEGGLTMIIIADTFDTEESEFHETLEDRVLVHDLIYNEGLDDKTYRIREYRKNTEGRWEVFGEPSTVIIRGVPLNYIPIFPLNGEVEPIKPMLTPLIDREVGLYNKVTRRNHLLYSASTYTPIIFSNMTDDDFAEVVDAGLGSWLLLQPEDKVDVLTTPTEAIKDLETSITNTVSEMARLGVRMMAPESAAAQSGIALDIRNAAQTARLGLLSSKIGAGMSQVICTMLNWKFEGLELVPSDIGFKLTSDFNPAPIPAEFLRLVGDWYEGGLIDRQTFISALKANELMDDSYDDDEAIEAINQDELVAGAREAEQVANKAIQIED